MFRGVRAFRHAACEAWMGRSCNANMVEALPVSGGATQWARAMRPGPMVEWRIRGDTGIRVRYWRAGTVIDSLPVRRPEAGDDRGGGRDGSGVTDRRGRFRFLRRVVGVLLRRLGG